MIKLSIIIPAYNAEPYIYELFDCLNPQITDEVEVMVVDDGSKIPVEAKYPWIKLHRKENGGVSTARNYGIEHTSGEYIAFIDADDLVADNYISSLLSKINNEHFDYAELSWKSLPGPTEQYVCKMNSFADKMQNPSACTRAFKRSFIGKVRFNTKKISSEDENFTRQLDFEHGKRAIVSEFMYFYRTNNPNSKSHRFWRGELDTIQIVYHYEHVTKDMTWLIDEIKKEDEHNCVWLLTNQNDLPELEKYCRVRKPHRIRGMELRGEPTPLFIKVETPIKAKIVLYMSRIYKVSGINTFIANFCKHFEDTLVLYDIIDQDALENLGRYTKLCKNDLTKNVVCDSLIMVSIKDTMPKNVSFERSIRTIHACKSPGYHILDDCDHIVNVSEFSKSTWGNEAKDGVVIKNLYGSPRNEMLLVSATRIGSSDKGENDKRFRKLAEKLNAANIDYIWLNFSDVPLDNPPKNFINMGPRQDVSLFMELADYVVQLSDDKEAFCYTIFEAMCNQTPVITTNLSVLPELGFKDGVNGYIVPFDLNFDVTKLKTRPHGYYKPNLEEDVKKWNKLLSTPGHRRLGSTVKPTKVQPTEIVVPVRVLKNFKDAHTGELIKAGVNNLPLYRVNEILQTQESKKIKLIEVI